MESASEKNRKVWGLSLILALTIVLVASCSPPVTTGKVSGDIRFEPTSADILNQLNVDPPVIGGPVQASDIGTGFTGTAQYIIGAQNTPPNLASYEMTPPVDANGTIFNMSVIPMLFESGAIYRFGTGDSTSPDAHLLPSPVFPLDTDPDGESFDIVECAVLANVNIQLTGQEEDLDALSDSDPVMCKATARVDGITHNQATSKHTYIPLADLRGTGGVVSFLVRGNSQLSVNVRCVPTVIAGEEGFPIAPGTSGNKAEYSVDSIQFTTSCPDSAAIDIDVPVQRNAGVLRGLLDTIGSGDEKIVIKLLPIGFDLEKVVIPSDTPHTWQFDGAPEGTYTVSASTLLEGGRAAITYPFANLVTVNIGQITDLRSMFIAEPRWIESEILLRDPGPDSKLTLLSTDPINSAQPPGVALESSNNIRFTGATGIAVDENGNIGVGGTGGIARGVLTGTFDVNLGEARLQARTPVVGLSPSNGSLDGSDARPADWDLDSLNLYFKDSITPSSAFTERLKIKPGYASRFTATPGEDANTPPINICFAEAQLQFQSDEFTSLLKPVLGISGSTIESPQVAYQVTRGRAKDGPLLASNAQDSVTVAAALPALLSYQIRPMLNIFNDAEGTETYVTLDTRQFPTNGFLKCADRRKECIALSGDTIASEFYVNLQTPEVFCEGQPVILGVNAHSTGGEIQSLAIQIEGESPMPVCSPCANPFTDNFLVPNLDPGSYSVLLTGQDSNGCPAELGGRTINVVAEELTLSCPDNIVVFPSESEESVPYTRVADDLLAEWIGGCTVGSFPPIQDNHPEIFPVGTTGVVFSSTDPSVGEQTCTTTVTVEPPSKCNDFGELPVGIVSEVATAHGIEFAMLTHDNLKIYPLAEGTSIKAVDWFPPAPHGDGLAELAVSQGLRIDFPFAVRWLSMKYVKGNPHPITVKAFKKQPGGPIEALSWSSPADEPERTVLTKAIPADPLNQLEFDSIELSGADGELMLLSICYGREASTLQPGDVFVVPQP